MAIITINQVGNMKIKALYRKNLKMSEGKMAAQVAHAVKNLGYTPKDCSIIVLGVSDKKFNELITEQQNKGTFISLQVDMGLTEIPEGTETAVAWSEKVTIKDVADMIQNAKPDPKNAVRMIDHNGEEIYY